QREGTPPAGARGRRVTAPADADPGHAARYGAREPSTWGSYAVFVRHTSSSVVQASGDGSAASRACPPQPLGQGIAQGSRLTSHGGSPSPSAKRCRTPCVRARLASDTVLRPPPPR